MTEHRRVFSTAVTEMFECSCPVMIECASGGDLASGDCCYCRCYVASSLIVSGTVKKFCF